MSKSHTPKTAFPTGKGNSTLAEAWCTYLNNPDNGSDPLATLLNARLLTLWPNGSGERLIKEYAPEIRQDALILTMARYLANNPRLQIASKRSDLPSISRQVERSLRGALHVVILRTRRAARQRTRFISLEDVDEECLPSILHPAERRDFQELSTEARLAVVKAALDGAMLAKTLPRRTVELVNRMFKGGLKTSDLAREQKVSRQAIHQALKPVRHYLRRHIQAQELPLEDELMP